MDTRSGATNIGPVTALVMAAITRGRRVALSPLAVAIVLGAAVLALLPVAPPRALAHAEYERSTPGADGVVRTSPARIDVWFTQELFRRAGANELRVLTEDGRRVDDAQPVVDDADRSQLSVQVAEELGPGVYTVEWRSLSALDGDTAEGSFRFTVDPSAPEPTAPPSSSNAGDAGATEGADAVSVGGGVPLAVWVAVLAAALGLCGFAIVRTVTPRTRGAAEG